MASGRWGLVRRFGVGPLGGFVEGFAAELEGRGYSWPSSEAQLGLMRHLSRWLEARGLTAADLDRDVVDAFVVDRRVLYVGLRSERALRPLLGHLRGLGVAPAAATVVALSPTGVVIERFARHLSGERSLAGSTVRSYVSQVRPFLAAYGPDEEGRVTVTARQVTAFVTARGVGQRPRSAAVGANAVRALLRWMWREGIVAELLADAVGTFAGPTQTTVPRALTAAEVARLGTGLSADPVARLRDEPMLALMWRLGLRAGEVAALRLDDISWRTGVVVVTGKRDRRDRVPLPVDVGELLVAYLRHGRAVSTHRQVFLGVDAPHQILGAAAVSSVAARALDRAGITGAGAAHRLRHTVACGVLAGGGGLVEAGQLLRHSSPQATAVYAKADVTALAVLARPWPGQVGR
jgi:integrase/recombinase XerD